MVADFESDMGKQSHLYAWFSIPIFEVRHFLLLPKLLLGHKFSFGSNINSFRYPACSVLRIGLSGEESSFEIVLTPSVC